MHIHTRIEPQVCSSAVWSARCQLHLEMYDSCPVLRYVVTDNAEHPLSVVMMIIIAFWGISCRLFEGIWLFTETNERIILLTNVDIEHYLEVSTHVLFEGARLDRVWAKQRYPETQLSLPFQLLICSLGLDGRMKAQTSKTESAEAESACKSMFTNWVVNMLQAQYAWRPDWTLCTVHHWLLSLVLDDSTEKQTNKQVRAAKPGLSDYRMFYFVPGIQAKQVSCNRL